MSEVIISVENLSKQYRLGKIGGRTLHDDLNRWWAHMRGRPDPMLKIGQENHVNSRSGSIWALRDVSFEVKQGEVLGIIGRNGAGKSTLLKILSRITAPTIGRVKIKGRIAALLEVGTGFHPELTGRENVFLNGAILGMKRAEIARKFDEIVDFSGVEQFIDTPVKRYSSGMHVRLAFAVAAHLEPEVLVVDEVLAVGDAEFQKKCMGKMGAVARGGRTVLFVSHNMGAILQLCPVSLLLANGKIAAFGATETTIRAYLAIGSVHSGSVDLTEQESRIGSGGVQFQWVGSRDGMDKTCHEFHIGDDVKIAFGLKASAQHQREQIKVAIEIRGSDGLRLCNLINSDSKYQINLQEDCADFSVKISDIRLYPDTYYLSLWVGDTSSREVYDYVQDCLSFRIIDGGRLTVRPLPRSTGLLFWTPEWTEG